MDDGRLRAVLMAVDRGSFSKAAAELGYTQSAMTHLVNNLEAELGCTLLNRGSHGVRLSEEGEQLLPYIKSVIDACDALRQEAASQSRTMSHQLSLGCFASIARAELPTILQEFKAAYPDIEIEVTIRGYELPRLLSNGEVQLALVDETCAEGFEWIPLTRVPLVAVVPPSFRWDRERISIGRLLKEPFITCPEQYAEKLLPPNAKRIQVEASDDATILSLVAGGLGVSVLSAFSLAGYEGQVKSIPLDVPVVVRVGIAIKSLESASTSARRFVKFLKNHYDVSEALF